ncbi:MAG TPA: hypothetical protein VFL99_01750 [Segeticoccus sp.]|uniref:AMIN-like domain-containing (lipo)protein n=1 Tax=Segeticoccus sp. TaxID=2706531 RepID=UPI002D7E7DBB|nr:hypothetical protein [Segeticoccus sp.]HET8599019.1 hypothetical protein [Segeticoccus sp.]
MNRFHRHLLPAALALALTGASAVAVGTTAASAGTPAVTASSPSCSTTWGSLAKNSTPLTTSRIGDVRTGQHTCFDRLVVDLAGNHTRAGYTVRYVSTVRAEGSGTPVPLRGGARLQVTAHAPTTRSWQHPTELADVTGYRTFRQVAWAGSFEGYSTVGLGVRARLPFRVLTLDGPGNGTRLVVDVAHHW